MVWTHSKSQQRWKVGADVLMSQGSQHWSPSAKLFLESLAETCRQLMLPNVFWPYIQPCGKSYMRLQNQTPFLSQLTTEDLV